MPGPPSPVGPHPAALSKVSQERMGSATAWPSPGTTTALSGGATEVGGWARHGCNAAQARAEMQLWGQRAKAHSGGPLGGGVYC